MLRRLLVALCVLLAAGVFVSAEARRRHHHYDGGGDDGRLVVLAEIDVDMNQSDFTVDVRAAKGAYRAVRIKNASGYLFDVRRVEVIYRDGRPWVEDRQIDMYSGERSREINPTAEAREVEYVKVTQEPRSGRGRFQVIGVRRPESYDGGGYSRRRDRDDDRDYGSRDRDRDRGYDDGRGRDREDYSVREPATDLGATPTTAQPSSTPAGQQTEDGAVMFGWQYVGFGVDRDVIKVGAEVGKFRRIRLRVLDNDIHINSLSIVYADGTSEELAVNADLPKNSRTSWIKLTGDRFIKEIQLSYRSRLNFNGQARLEVLGQYAPGWLNPGGEGSRYNQGWVLLGAETARFVGYDKATINVPNNEGGFRQLRVGAKVRNVTVKSIKVYFADGYSQEFPVNQQVKDGEYTVVDMPGDRQKRIDRIEGTWRSRIFGTSVFQGSAVVDVWGKH